MATNLDLRSIHLGETNLLTFERRRDAESWCRANMLPTCHATKAANRFWAFYVIARTFPDDTWTLRTKSGTWRAMPFPGYLAGKNQ